MTCLFFILTIFSSLPYYELLVQEKHQILNEQLKNQRKKYLNFLQANFFIFESNFNLIILYLLAGLKKKNDKKETRIALDDTRRIIENIFKSIYLLGVKLIYVNGISNIQKNYDQIFTEQLDLLLSEYTQLGKTNLTIKKSLVEKIDDVRSNLIRSGEKFKKEFFEVKYF